MLSDSKSERQRTSGPQKRMKSEFIYREQGYRPRSRKLDLPLSADANLDYVFVKKLSDQTCCCKMVASHQLLLISECSSDLAKHKRSNRKKRFTH